MDIDTDIFKIWGDCHFVLYETGPDKMIPRAQFTADDLYQVFMARMRKENVVCTQQNLESIDDLVGYIEYNPEYYAEDFEDGK